MAALASDLRPPRSRAGPLLTALLDELSALGGDGVPARAGDVTGEVAVPLRLRRRDRELRFISTNTTFARATDITVAELSIESFFPTDAATAQALRDFAA
jgi:MmyB-like transcription regulator ligand binding domain